jgi:hypothetical protein
METCPDCVTKSNTIRRLLDVIDRQNNELYDIYVNKSMCNEACFQPYVMQIEIERMRLQAARGELEPEEAEFVSRLKDIVNVKNPFRTTETVTCSSPT